MNTTCEETDKKPPENERNDAPAREAKTLKYSSGVGRAMLLTGISALAVSLGGVQARGQDENLRG